MHRHSFLKKLVNTGLVVHFLQGKTIKKEAAPYGASFCLAVPPKLTCVLLYSLYRASPSDSSSTAPERNKYVLLLPRPEHVIYLCDFVRCGVVGFFVLIV